MKPKDRCINKLRLYPNTEIIVSRGCLEVAGPCSYTGLLLWEANLCRALDQSEASIPASQPIRGQHLVRWQSRRRTDSEVYAEACRELRSEDSLAQSAAEHIEIALGQCVLSLQLVMYVTI